MLKIHAEVAENAEAGATLASAASPRHDFASGRAVDPGDDPEPGAASGHADPAAGEDDSSALRRAVDAMAAAELLHWFG